MIVPLATMLVHSRSSYALHLITVKRSVPDAGSTRQGNKQFQLAELWRPQTSLRSGNNIAFASNVFLSPVQSSTG